MPGWETEAFGYTLSWNVFVPGMVIPGVLFTVFMFYPFIEAWITGDKREHHLLERPRDAPNRTAFLVGFMTLYGLGWAAGGNDIIAIVFNLNLNYITYFMRVALFVLPVLAFFITRRWCISLQRADQDKLLHGYETGVIMRSADGSYSERHAPIKLEDAYTITARDRDPLYELEAETDKNGIPAPHARVDKLRAKVSRFWFANNIQKPTREELQHAHEHAEEQLALQSADGHQHDGRSSVDGDELRRP
jgi:ubiquinol-cytochrome c reductase cytochrome b subunit